MYYDALLCESLETCCFDLHIDIWYLGLGVAVLVLILGLLSWSWGCCLGLGIAGWCPGVGLGLKNCLLGLCGACVQLKRRHESRNWWLYHDADRARNERVVSRSQGTQASKLTRATSSRFNSQVSGTEALVNVLCFILVSQFTNTVHRNCVIIKTLL